MKKDDFKQELTKTQQLIDDATLKIKHINEDLKELEKVFVEINELILGFKKESSLNGGIHETY